MTAIVSSRACLPLILAAGVLASGCASLPGLNMGMGAGPAMVVAPTRLNAAEVVA